jgi:hypothetical protein
MEDSPAPGTEGEFSTFYRDTPGINRFGQIAFLNMLQNVPAATNNSLWATDLDGNPMLIARQGQTVEVAPGQTRIFSSLSMLTNHGDDDGRPRAINDLGQVAFAATFTGGGSGIFLSNAVAHLPGDYNGDGIVGAADYSVWRNGLSSQNLAADGTRDGVVDRDDYDLWKEFYGISLDGPLGTSVAIVPEPRTASLILLSIIATTTMWNGRRRLATEQLNPLPSHESSSSTS